MVLTAEHIAQIKKLLHDALIKEWRAQGHFMNGKVVEDIEYEIAQTFEGLSITGFMYAYGGYINTGVSAGDIPFTPGSGAKKSKYIDGLTRYVQKRMGITELKTAKSVAFAIAHTQKKEGMPTGGSYRFSSTGKRTEWINDALQKNRDLIGEYLRQFYANYMRSNFTQLLITYGKTI